MNKPRHKNSRSNKAVHISTYAQSMFYQVEDACYNPWMQIAHHLDSCGNDNILKILTSLQITLKLFLLSEAI